MDRTSRFVLIFSFICLVLLGISLFWNKPHWRPRIWQINEILEQDETLADSPYQFRALTYMGDTVALSSPRGTPEQLPAVLAQLASDPALAKLPPTAPELKAVDARLRRYELYATELLQAEPDIQSVRWMLDKAWYHRHGLELPSR